MHYHEEPRDNVDARVLEDLCLASSSPRRRELLASIGIIPQRIEAAEIDESLKPGEDPTDYVARMACEKAHAIRSTKRVPASCWVLGADTAVVVEQSVLGKPRDYHDFCSMFERLSGAQHEVLSAVSLFGPKGQHYHCVVMSDVSFRPVSVSERDAYWMTGEPQDKAGGYAIQGVAAQFVQRISGSYSGIVGLPLFETAKLLAQAGWNLLEPGKDAP